MLERCAGESLEPAGMKQHATCIDIWIPLEPPEPEEDEKGEGEDDGSKKKPRKNVMQTFLKVLQGYKTMI